MVLHVSAGTMIRFCIKFSWGLNVRPFDAPVNWMGTNEPGINFLSYQPGESVQSSNLVNRVQMPRKPFCD